MDRRARSVRGDVPGLILGPKDCSVEPKGFRPARWCSHQGVRPGALHVLQSSGLAPEAAPVDPASDSCRGGWPTSPQPRPHHRKAERQGGAATRPPRLGHDCEGNSPIELIGEDAWRKAPIAQASMS